MDTKKDAIKISHCFPNGTKVEGTFEELQTIAKAIGQPLTGLSFIPRGHYNSGTSGLVKISDMHSYHIRRALLKVTTEYMKKVFASKDTNSTFLKKYAGLVDEPLVMDFLDELVKRGDEVVGTPPTAIVEAAASVGPKKPAKKEPVKISSSSKR